MRPELVKDNRPVTYCEICGAEPNFEGCPHLNFNAFADVNRINKEGGDPNVIVAYTCDLQIQCRECGQPFEFLGLPVGMTFYRPTVNLNGQEARLPIAIPGTRPPDGMPGYSVTCESFEAPEPVKN